MIEFTFWDILRNLLLAARWTVLLSLAAFVGGGVVGMAMLFFRIAKNKWARRVASGYIALFQGTPLLMQLFLMFFGLPMLGLAHRTVDRGRARPHLLRQRLSRRDLARRRRCAAARPVGCRRQPRPALSAGAPADHPAAGVFDHPRADRRLPGAAGQERPR